MSNQEPSEQIELHYLETGGNSSKQMSRKVKRTSQKTYMSLEDHEEDSIDDEITV